jgi:hypothetical protein
MPQVLPGAIFYAKSDLAGKISTSKVFLKV